MIINFFTRLVKLNLKIDSKTSSLNLNENEEYTQLKVEQKLRNLVLADSPVFFEIYID